MAEAKALPIERRVNPFTERQAGLFNAAVALLRSKGRSVVSYVGDETGGEHLVAETGHLTVECFRVETFEKKREINVTVKDGDRLVFDTGFVLIFEERHAEQEDFVRTDLPGSWEDWLHANGGA